MTGLRLNASLSDSSYAVGRPQDSYAVPVRLDSALGVALKRGAFTCVGRQVTRCDPTWQVTLRSSAMGYR